MCVAYYHRPHLHALKRDFRSYGLTSIRRQFIKRHDVTVTRRLDDTTWTVLEASISYRVNLSYEWHNLSATTRADDVVGLCPRVLYVWAVVLVHLTVSAGTILNGAVMNNISNASQQTWDSVLRLTTVRLQLKHDWYQCKYKLLSAIMPAFAVSLGGSFLTRRISIGRISILILHRGRHTKIFGWAKSLPPPLPFLPL